ncbi:MAG: hypothetical protein EBZ76_14040, partial [Synechococcaceae bacterium WB9_2_170]|nr:hypothetical protein [Synechococcaceae bacterium WB9_2_170]
EVTVVVELKARFDEEANINWAEKLERIGAQVVYGVVGLKTHAKMMLISRREGAHIRRYVHLSTGNYNPRTAKLYTDISHLSADNTLTAEVESVFGLLASQNRPTRLQQLAGILERGLLSPLLLAALADDMPNLRLGDGRVVADGPARNSMQLWRREAISDGNLPTSLGAWLAHGAPNDAPPESSQRPAHTSPQSSQLAAGLLWCNVGLEAPSQGQQKLNRFTAQILNRLGANLIAGHPIAQAPWVMEGCCSARQWVGLLLHQGWRIKAQLRASVASFGLGASMPITGQGWVQVPLALPMRTGLLDTEGQEQQALLPHSCLELAMSHGGQSILLQYYQGTEGLCGWEALNDLERPWQNNR